MSKSRYTIKDLKIITGVTYCCQLVSFVWHHVFSGYLIISIFFILGLLQAKVALLVATEDEK